MYEHISALSAMRRIKQATETEDNCGEGTTADSWTRQAEMRVFKA